MTREDRPDTGRDRRIEPRIDWTRIVAAPRARRDHPVPAWRDRRYWRWSLLVALLLVVLLVVFRRPLADVLWPETRVQALLDQAARALADRNAAICTVSSEATVFWIASWSMRSCGDVAVNAAAKVSVRPPMYAEAANLSTAA